MAMDSGELRIGEFARRVGVTPELLRAWESRYGLTRPVRSPGGFRLYTAADAARVERMRRGLDQGLSAAEAARAALEDERPSEGMLEDLAARLSTAVSRYDEAALHSVLDESLAAFGLDETLRHVVLPTLKEVGDGWKGGEIEISQEHFGSNLIRGRLLALARFWGRGTGPLALLACAPGEMHDITLLAFALVLRSHSWRILFLGADTPIATLARAAETTGPALVVVSSFDPALLEAQASSLRRLARTVPLALAGPGATHEFFCPCGRPPPGRGSRSGSRRSGADVTAVSVSGPQRPVVLITGATCCIGGRLSACAIRTRASRAARPSPTARAIRLRSFSNAASGSIYRIAVDTNRSRNGRLRAVPPPDLEVERGRIGRPGKVRGEEQPGPSVDARTRGRGSCDGGHESADDHCRGAGPAGAEEDRRPGSVQPQLQPPERERATTPGIGRPCNATRRVRHLRVEHGPDRPEDL